MVQTRFSIISVAAEKKERLDNKMKELYHNMKSKFKNFGTYQDVVGQSSSYGSKDLKDEQEPEEFAKRNLIEPLIEFLGFETVSETVLPSPLGKKKPDYTIRPRNQEKPIFYVEAESFNTDLLSEGHGKSQVDSWLISRASKTNYGISTDGFQWVLIKFDTASAKGKIFFEIDLRPVFLKILSPGSFITKEEVDKIEESFLNLDCEYVLQFLENYLEKIEEDKEDISKRFYNDYVKYVFGVDEKGNIIKGTWLLKEVAVPSGEVKNHANLFSVIFMNRLIFVKFLEEKGLVPKNLLKKLLDKYRSSGIPGTFYETYLKLLFYEVFNKGHENRISVVKTNPLYKEIPYLNGGLFRQVIPSESSYNISNEGVELALENLLEKYTFGLESGINPDILGYIFEKTINFISGTGTNQQKAQGAYYTPDDVVEFIIEETLIPVVFNKMLEGLKNAGWTDIDLKGYDTIETLLNSKNMPKNPLHVRKMIAALDTIRVLDPACGSGHFLTAMLSQILRVEESLLRSIGEKVDRYSLKRQIISKNLFGVDINENAVEIARLRLWLSLIEEVKDPTHIETLPNIDFNIVSGNALIGWLNESLMKHPLINLSEDALVKETMVDLNQVFESQINEVRNLLSKMKMEDTIKAYERLIEIYSLESGEHAVKVKEALEKIRNKLYEVINSSYVDFLHEKSNLSRNDICELSKNLETRTPFHWKVDFGNVFATGGFDVVVGNPPYIEDGNYDSFDIKVIESLSKVRKGKKGEKGKPLLYDSMNCGNTHAYFIERSIKILADNGKFGFIVPISLVSTDRMYSIREFIHQNSSEVKYYNFDDRPGKIFSGLEHCRATIVVIKKGKCLTDVTTSKYHRWHTKDRPKLLKELKTVSWIIVDEKSIVPKIGTKIEKKIIEKLEQKANVKTIGDFLTTDGKKIWYHNAPQYWIHAHTEEYLPKVEYFNKYTKNNQTGEIIPCDLREIKASSQYKSLTANPRNLSLLNGLINSSLFYWWFVIWSDGRHLLNSHIESFPFDMDSGTEQLRKDLYLLVSELMQSYDKNSNTRINIRSGGSYCIRIKEIIPKRSKDIIDQIDDILAEHFGFTEKEKEFIKKFDIEFRVESTNSE
jgi:type I restriction-modification system DNA methylase subunit